MDVRRMFFHPFLYYITQAREIKPGDGIFSHICV